VQSIQGAHKLGIHHLAAAENGRLAASGGFGGEIKIWCYNEADSQWRQAGIIGANNSNSELWALAMTADAKYLAASAYDGKVHIWDLEDGKDDSWQKYREYETKGSFGMCVAMVSSVPSSLNLVAKID